MVDSGARAELSQHPGHRERRPGDLLAPTLPGGEPIEKLLRGAQFSPLGSRPLTTVRYTARAAVRPRSTSGGGTTRWSAPRTG